MQPSKEEPQEQLTTPTALSPSEKVFHFIKIKTYFVKTLSKEYELFSFFVGKMFKIQ